MKLKKSKTIHDFRDMIRLRTISYSDGEKTDREAFRRMKELIAGRFPFVSSLGETEEVGEYGLLIRIPGRRQEKPSVLMAHMDVVPAEQKAWCCDPFAAEIIGDRIYGRGTLDTKSTLWAILEAMEYRLSGGFLPENDIWLSFGGEEEICGSCCREIVGRLKARGVRPSFVLDEGGSVIPEGLPGLRRQAAMIGIAEKGTANYLLTVSGGGGHASVPAKNALVDRAAQAAVRIRRHPFPARLSTAVKLMFRELADEVPFFEKPVFAHPELAAPAVAAAASVLGGTFDAMVRTTVALTVMEGGSELNVLPDSVSLGLNVRLLEGDTVAGAADRILRTVRDPGFRIEVVNGTNPSPVSEIRCPEYDLLRSTVRETWPGAVVAPYQMNGGTDARFYSELTDHIYRFSPMIMTKEERSSVHGANESVAFETLFTMIRFYIRLIGKL